MPTPSRRRIRIGVTVAVALFTISLLAPPATAVPTAVRQAPPSEEEAANYVSWIYESLLFRMADPEGLAFWTSAIQHFPRDLTVLPIATSQEFRGAWVNAFYESIWLDRAADPGALTYWGDFVGGPTGFDVFETALGSSDEVYALAGGTDEAYVEFVYEAATFAAPTADELAEGLEALGTGTRQEFVHSVLHSDAGVASRVMIAYERALDREPDPAGAEYWAGVYHQYPSMWLLLTSMIQSDEAFELAQAPGVAARSLREIAGR